MLKAYAEVFYKVAFDLQELQTLRRILVENALLVRTKRLGLKHSLPT